MKKIDPVTTKEYIQKYFGYGNLSSPYWFIGKEEGGGKDATENIHRIELWRELGSNQTNDMYDFHRKLGFTDHQLSRFQQTWAKLTQLMITVETGEDFISKDDKRQYLLQSFGRYTTNQALLELMPIAARSTSKDRWLGSDVFQAPEMADRDAYFQLYLPERIKALRNLIHEHRPKMVVFYSSLGNYVKWWSEIAGSTKWIWEQLDKSLSIAYSGSRTLYVITPHSTRPGIKGKDFYSIGLRVRELLK